MTGLMIACPVIFILLSTDVPAADITEITGATFPNYHITSVNIGTDVSSISTDAFSNLHDLKKITVSKNNRHYSSYGNCLYDKDQTELICFPQALDGANIPSTVTSIAPGALEGRSQGFRKKVADVVADNAVRSAEVKEKNKTTSDDNRDKEESDTVSISCADTPLGNEISKVLSSLNVSGMTKEAALRACYDYLMKNCSYRRFTDVFDSGWTSTYALDLLTTGKGNCASYAASLAYLARALGYESRVATGSIDAASGFPTSHAWTEIRIDGRWYIFDAEMDQAKANKEYYRKTYSDYPSTGLTKEQEWSCEF